MRKLLIFTFTMLLSVVHAAAQNNATLVLWHADGTTDCSGRPLGRQALQRRQLRHLLVVYAFP